IFADSAFVIMSSINKTLSLKARASFAATTVALGLGLTATHSLVPPTPGPIATAGMLGADLGAVIFWGAVVSIIALIPAYFFVKHYVSRFHMEPPAITPEVGSDERKYP